MQKVLGWVAVLALVVGFIVLIYAGIWWLYITVMPMLWPSGPENVIRPGFWLFIGALTLLSLIGNILFGGRK